MSKKDKAKAPAKAKAKAAPKKKVARDKFGLTMGTLTQKAVGLYEKGATTAEIQKGVPSKTAHLNILTRLEAEGHTVRKEKIENEKGRKVVKYTLTFVAAAVKKAA